MLFFDDPSVKDFMVQVVKRTIGILDSWITSKYHLEKCVDCPKCRQRIVIGKDAELVRNNNKF